MEKSPTSIVKKSLASWILTGNYKLKLLLILAAVTTVLIRIIPLEMQKRIANQENKKRVDISREFSGKIEEMGTYDELMEKKGLLYELATGRR